MADLASVVTAFLGGLFFGGLFGVILGAAAAVTAAQDRAEEDRAAEGPYDRPTWWRVTNDGRLRRVQ